MQASPDLIHFWCTTDHPQRPSLSLIAGFAADKFFLTLEIARTFFASYQTHIGGQTVGFHIVPLNLVCAFSVF